jgi:hypothetical protein
MSVCTWRQNSESSSPNALKFWHNVAFEYARVFIYGMGRDGMRRDGMGRGLDGTGTGQDGTGWDWATATRGRVQLVV